MRVGLFLSVWLLLPAVLFAQPAELRVEVRAAGAPVEAAEVVLNETTTRTDANGIAVLSAPSGAVTLVVVKEGFVTASQPLNLAAGQAQTILVELVPSPTVEETVTVAATRTGKRLEDQPMRVEVLEQEEIEEKMLMTPGDIVMMLNEMGGMRVQATSPALGAASVRIQGMRGRYTRFLMDGLPLFGEQVGSLGLLQIPPADLGRVEVIKGVASSLYGAGAMAGVVNLISKRPGAEPGGEVLLNRSSRRGTDAVGFYATPLSRGWSLSTLASGHFQDRVDVNGDAWSDLPEYTRGVFRPRVFWDDQSGRSFFATAGVTIEDREGGTARDQILPQAGTPYVEALETRRIDMGAVGQQLFQERYVLTARFAAAQQRHRHQFGEVLERDQHRTAFGEIALRASSGRHTWVIGSAVQYDSYKPTDVPQFSYSFTVPGVFAQDDIEITNWLSLSASGRFDHHSEYGSFFSPRVAALVRSGAWNARLSVGRGFFGPSPLTEETEAAGLSRLSIPLPLRAETGTSTSLDVTRAAGPLSYTLTLFASRVAHPIDVSRETAYVLANSPEPTTNVGYELLGTYRREPFSLTGTYTYVRSKEVDGGVRVDSPLTPRHSAGIVGMWEREDLGRVGIELYYTGIQRLEASPYSTQSEPYLVLGLLAERQFGHLRFFINGENLTNQRQTRFGPMVLPTRAVDGRWTVDAWAPLEGRNVNGGVRVLF